MLEVKGKLFLNDYTYNFKLLHLQHTEIIYTYTKLTFVEL